MLMVMMKTWFQASSIQAVENDNDNDDEKNYNGDNDDINDNDEDLVPGTLGPGGGGVKQAMQAATARRMSRMQTFFNIIFSLHLKYFSNIV